MPCLLPPIPDEAIRAIFTVSSSGNLTFLILFKQANMSRIYYLFEVNAVGGGGGGGGGG